MPKMSALRYFVTAPWTNPYLKYNKYILMSVHGSASRMAKPSCKNSAKRLETDWKSERIKTGESVGNLEPESRRGDPDADSQYPVNPER